MVGMRDVAKAAGVSLSTVSLVVNNTGYVSADMRAKVESAMRQLNYIPNELARNLYRNRTNTIGVIMPTIAHPFFSTLTAHLQREFAARDLKTLLCSTADTDKGESEYIDMLQRHMMDGIIMAAHTEHPADYWTSIHRPIVAFDRTLGEGVPVVRSDHEQGGRLIARQLIDSGARHVVLVGGPRSQFAEGTTYLPADCPPCRKIKWEDGTLAGRRKVVYSDLDGNGHVYNAVYAGIACDYVEAGAVADIAAHEATACAIFEQYPDVDAIVGSDVVASVALQEASRRGIEVPADLQVIAYDGTLMAETAGKRLTAIRQDFPAIAAALAVRMDSQIAADGGPASPSKNDSASDVDTQPTPEEVIPVALIPGETTR